MEESSNHQKESQTELKKTEVDIYYEKNPLYRSIYCDGAIGGITPTKAISLSFYASRQAIPKSIKHRVSPEGFLGDVIEVSKDSKSGIIREIEVGIYISKQTARDLYEYLKKIVEHDNE